MKEPKDFHLARRAYEVFWDEQPQIWFEQLSHDYQMRWVRVARAVTTDAKEYNRFVPRALIPGERILTEEEARDIIKNAPKRNRGKSTRVNHKVMTKQDSDLVKRAYVRLKTIRESSKR